MGLEREGDAAPIRHFLAEHTDDDTERAAEAYGALHFLLTARMELSKVEPRLLRTSIGRVKNDVDAADGNDVVRDQHSRFADQLSVHAGAVLAVEVDDRCTSVEHDDPRVASRD